MSIKQQERARWIVHTRELAELLDMSDRAVRKLTQEGVLQRVSRGRYDLRDALPAYVRHIRGALGVKPDDIPDLAEARARQALSAAKVNELKAAELEGKLVRREVVEEIFGRVSAALRSSLSALPSKARGRIPHMTAADAGELDSLLRDILRDIPREAGLPEMVLAGEAGGGDDASDAGGN